MANIYNYLRRQIKVESGWNNVTLLNQTVNIIPEHTDHTLSHSKIVVYRTFSEYTFISLSYRVHLHSINIYVINRNSSSWILLPIFSNNTQHWIVQFLRSISCNSKVEMIVLRNLESPLQENEESRKRISNSNLDQTLSQFRDEILLNIKWSSQPIISTPIEIHGHFYLCIVVNRRMGLNEIYIYFYYMIILTFP